MVVLEILGHLFTLKLSGHCTIVDNEVRSTEYQKHFREADWISARFWSSNALFRWFRAAESLWLLLLYVVHE